jgi:ketosteroid isomerase-like protein
MYHAIVRRRAVGVFGRLDRGEWGSLLATLAEDVHHSFPGDHPLGGERRTRQAVLRWLERLDRLFPGHAFQVHRVSSRGWPWDTWVAVQWSARLAPQVGEPYTNHGTHWIQIRWGRVSSLHAYLDTQLIADACRSMVERGVLEAGAEPIADAR